VAQLATQQAAQVAAVAKLEVAGRALCTPAMKSRLVADGFAHLDAAVPPDIVRRALKEVNRQIGVSSTGTDKFKAKLFATNDAVLDLARQSKIPFVLAELLGGDAAEYREQLESGQIALRFPGDLCQGETADSSDEHFESIRKYWHIDGCASDFLPGVTDHHGEIHNFTALVGVLLADIVEPMSGELCCYPNSPAALAEFFKVPGQIEKVRVEGDKALPTGDRTDKTFAGRAPVHCLGKAGDAFIVNYLTAHFIAPNTSPYIRYAVYFRVSAPSLHRRRGQHGTAPPTAALMSPWLDWPGVGGGGGDGGGGVGEARSLVCTTDTTSETAAPQHVGIAEAHAYTHRAAVLAATNYDHTRFTSKSTSGTPRHTANE
jgi:hypothetical protein